MRRAQSTATTPPSTPTPAAVPEAGAEGAQDEAEQPGDGEENKESWKSVVNQADTWMDVLKQQEDDRKEEEARYGTVPLLQEGVDSNVLSSRQPHRITS